MAKLFFRYGAMNCGKSTALLQVAHNYEERGLRVSLLKPSQDTKGGADVVSRLGARRSVDWLVGPHDDILFWLDRLEDWKKPDCLLVDEAQFLSPDQVSQLFKVAVQRNIPVLCYGLRADFKTVAFPGSLRLLEIAHKLEELKTICRCGKKAVFNARLSNGRFVSDGSQVAIDGQESISYESLCGGCYLKHVGNMPSLNALTQAIA